MITDLLTAGSKPRVNISAHPINQLYGDKVTVTADVMGLSVASYQWLKDDMDLSAAKYPACDGLGTNKLTISPFTHDHEGMYQCAVSFSDGKVVKSNDIKLALGRLDLTPSLTSSGSLGRGRNYTYDKYYQMANVPYK